MRDNIQIILLVIILILQIIFTAISFDVSHSITAGDIASMIQVVLIFVGFIIAYRQIVFSSKIAEANRIWEEIHPLELEWIGYRTIQARKYLDFLKEVEKKPYSEDLFENYFVDTIKMSAEFQVKLTKIADKLLYANPDFNKAIESFLEKENAQTTQFGKDFIIAFYAKSNIFDLSNEMKERGDELVKKAKKRFASIESIIENDDYKIFKDAVRKALLKW